MSQSTDHDTEQIDWFGPQGGPTGGEPGGSGLPPSGPFGPVPPQPAPAPHQHRRWTEIALAAVVAAVVAAGTTGGVIAATGTSSTGSTTSTSSTGAGSGSGGPAAAGTGSGPVASSGATPSWTKVAKAVQPSVVAISTTSQFAASEGSGVILDTAGRVLTNNHVVAGAAQGGTLTVTLSDGRSYQATIVGTDPSTDLAVISMKGATNLTPASLGDSRAVQVGSGVMAVGNPLGLAGTVTTGIVSALDRPVTTTNEADPSTGATSPAGTVVTNAIQTDAAVNPGNSGGALVDENGRVIGIPSSIASLGSSSASTQSGSIGLGFSIPINEAKSIADQLISTGRAQHPLLGVSLKDGTIAQGSAQRNAAIVASVQSGSPAAGAGIRTGDAVLTVDGASVNSTESLVAQIRERTVGTSVTLGIVRAGASKTVTVKLTSAPSASGS
jgi:putative serine protease PepD